MERWSGKIAVVTGASSGIGAAIAVDLCKAGLTVVGLARRVERIEALRTKVPENRAKSLHAFQCDITDEQSIRDAFQWIQRTLGGIDVLINNAGVFTLGYLLDDDDSQILTSTLQTNVIGLVQCTREACKSMRERQVAGHVVLINSLAGHNVLTVPGVRSMNSYAPSKYAVTAITEVLRQELNAQGSKTKITSISPGYVMTDVVAEELRNSDVPHMMPEDISAAVLYAIGTPPHVQVHELTVRTVGEPF